jgi:hypothetical protein
MASNSLERVTNPYDVGRLLRTLAPAEPEEERVPVRRPDDLLVFELAFQNLRLAPDQPPRLVREREGAPATLIVILPPQSFGEEALLEATPELEDDLGADPPVEKDKVVPEKHTAPGTSELFRTPKVRMAGPSRLAFAMPAEQESLEYSLAAVLEAMRTWPLRLSVSAQPDIAPPGPGRADRGTIRRALGDVGRMSRWAGVRHELTSTLEARGAAGVGPVIADAAARVAERIVPALAGASAECVAPVLQQSFFDELEVLTERFRSLREGPGRVAAAAALSLQAVEAVISQAGDLEVAMGVAEILENLPIVVFLAAPHEPPRTVTAIELPYRLALSPIEDARFLHRDEVVEHHGRSELWHTRMTTADRDTGADQPGRARTIWSPDYELDEPGITGLLVPLPRPFRMGLDPLDRQMLVRLMAGYNETYYQDVERTIAKRFYPRASLVERLHLSALGGLLDAEGSWDPRPDRVDLEAWRHVASLGRDAYVRVVYAGYLCPTGHACSLVKVTERKFERVDGASEGRVAVLRQRFYVLVRERLRRYDGKRHKDFEGRNFPFGEVEVLTRVTPNLLEPGAPASALTMGGQTIHEALDIAPRMVFWPMLAGPGGAIPFQFDIAATDLSGRRITFSAPLLFVSEVPNNDVEELDEILEAYNHGDSEARRRADIGGATVTFAPVDPQAEGDPRLPTERITLAAGDVTSRTTTGPNFYPEIGEARVGIRPLQKLLGLGRDAVVDVTYPDVYKRQGFGSANGGHIFLRLVEAHELGFGGDGARTDALGSLVTPEMSIRGLSRLIGPVGARPPADPTNPDSALDTLNAGEFDPADFFPEATILGGVRLADLLTATGLSGGDVPRMVTRELADRVEARFAWGTEITQSDPAGIFIPQAGPGDTRLELEGITTTPLGGAGDATFRAEGELNNFKVNLFGFVILWFERLRFLAETGKKPDVTVQLRAGDDAVQFGGPLGFVATLSEYLPSNGFSDPPAIEVTPTGIGASYFLNLPTVGVGVLSISNISLGAGFQLPFDGTPTSVTFGFSRRESPFSLTVMIFGGGGFFALGVSARGVTEVEAALEFGAGISIDLGVASGGVEVKAGIYFHWIGPQPDDESGSVMLAGYVRLHGELRVLAVISVTLTFNLQLAWKKESGTSIVWGEATLVVKVEVLLFSKSVSVRCRRKFSGSKSDPKFIAQMPSADLWAEYCGAFALEEVA